ncbi:MAG: dephospho-CoA kinase [Myxococcota bacterium]|nr:dephospho-CoA kinase [Myxococcota bacterium]
MKTIGLSGGISCGKSSVARILESLGVPIIDADQVAREIVSVGQEALKEIEEHFGSNILTPEGNLDRKALGAIVMQDAKQRKALERITHPKIKLSILHQLLSLKQDGHRAAVVEAALMVETGSFKQYDALIIVSCHPEIQEERLMKREGFSREEAQRWIASQLPLAEKEKHADWLINNSFDQQTLLRTVEKGWSKLLIALESAPSTSK